MVTKIHYPFTDFPDYDRGVQDNIVNQLLTMGINLVQLLNPKSKKWILINKDKGMIMGSRITKWIGVRVPEKGEL